MHSSHGSRLLAFLAATFFEPEPATTVAARVRHFAGAAATSSTLFAQLQGQQQQQRLAVADAANDTTSEHCNRWTTLDTTLQEKVSLSLSLSLSMGRRCYLDFCSIFCSQAHFAKLFLFTGTCSPFECLCLGAACLDSGGWGLTVRWLRDDGCGIVYGGGGGWWGW